MDTTEKSSQGYLSHSETESWAVTAASMPVISPEICLGPVRICVSISERNQNDKFMVGNNRMKQMWLKKGHFTAIGH